MSRDEVLEALMAGFDADAFRAALQRAYDEGRHSGLAEGKAWMRENILRAVGTDAEPVAPQMPAQKATPEAKPKRAPKGLTRQVIDEVLGKTPGLTVKQITDLALKIDPRVSPKTVYNLLNLNSEHYLARGEQWFIRANETPIIGAQSAAGSEFDIFN